MELDVKKEAMLEYCESIFALIVNYQKNHQDLEIEKISKRIEIIEDEIRNVDDEQYLDTIKLLIDEISKSLEVKINE